MTDLKQEAWTLTLGERLVLAARLAVLEHLRQSVASVPPHDYALDNDHPAQTLVIRDADLVGAP